VRPRKAGGTCHSAVRGATRLAGYGCGLLASARATKIRGHERFPETSIAVTERARARSRRRGTPQASGRGAARQPPPPQGRATGRGRRRRPARPAFGSVAYQGMIP